MPFCPPGNSSKTLSSNPVCTLVPLECILLSFRGCALSWFLEVLSKSIRPINFILGMHDLLGGIQNPIEYCRAPATFCRMLVSDWSMGFRKLSPKLLAPSTSYLVCMTSYMEYRTLLHIVVLQRLSAECWPLIGQWVSRSFLQNY